MSLIEVVRLALCRLAQSAGQQWRQRFVNIKEMTQPLLFDPAIYRQLLKVLKSNLHTLPKPTLLQINL